MSSWGSCFGRHLSLSMVGVVLGSQGNISRWSLAGRSESLGHVSAVSCLVLFRRFTASDTQFWFNDILPHWDPEKQTQMTLDWNFWNRESSEPFLNLKCFSCISIMTVKNGQHNMYSMLGNHLIKSRSRWKGSECHQNKTKDWVLNLQVEQFEKDYKVILCD